jgi:hypothetical protein
MPSYIPIEAQDLINRMLTVDPSLRISMQEIRHHPWFLKNLPEYLSLSPRSLMDARLETIDKDVVAEVCDILHLTEEQCIKDLQKGIISTSQAGVMYSLILDKKKSVSSGDKEKVVTNEGSLIFEEIEFKKFVMTMGSEGNLKDEIEEEEDDNEIIEDINNYTFSSPPSYPIQDFQTGTSPSSPSHFIVTDPNDESSSESIASPFIPRPSVSPATPPMSPSPYLTVGMEKSPSSIPLSERMEGLVPHTYISSNTRTANSSPLQSSSSLISQSSSNNIDVSTYGKEVYDNINTSSNPSSPLLASSLWATGIPRPFNKTRRKWMLGFESDNSISVVVNSLFVVLKEQGFEWRVLEHYQFICRLKRPSVEEEEKVYKSGKYSAEMIIQLLKIEETKDNVKKMASQLERKVKNNYSSPNNNNNNNKGYSSQTTSSTTSCLHSSQSPYPMLATSVSPNVRCTSPDAWQYPTSTYRKFTPPLSYFSSNSQTSNASSNSVASETFESSHLQSETPFSHLNQFLYRSSGQDRNETSEIEKPVKYRIDIRRKRGDVLSFMHLSVLLLGKLGKVLNH